jgi:hypothetical protein
MYKAFDSFIMRIPLYSLSWLLDMMKKSDIDSLLADKRILEALYLASPSLYSEISKFRQGFLNNKDQIRFKQSIWKYVKRMSTRCTPFGLFSSFSIGNVGASTQIKMDSFKRKTRLDMTCTYVISQILERNNCLKESLLYYPNSTIFELIGDNILLYTEEIFLGAVKSHIKSSVDRSDALMMILNKAMHGQRRMDLALSIVNDDINLEEALNFIDELIDNQLLISELYPFVTGGDLLDYIIAKLKSYQVKIAELDILSRIKEKLNNIDKTKLGETLNIYSELEGLIKELGIKIDRKYLFQCDLERCYSKLSIDFKIVNQLYEALRFVNRISFYNPNVEIEDFVRRFKERYDTAEIPLLEALDDRIGIGYRSIPYLDSLIKQMPINNKHPLKGMHWDKYEQILNRKYLEALKKGENIILDEFAFSEFEEKWDDIPATISVFCELYQNGEIFFNSAGNSSACNLISRFGHSSNVEKYLVEITQKENLLSCNDILAEVVHIPFSRTGNVLQRPKLREYEIPYFCNSFAKKIILSDLMVSIKGGKVILRSKKLNRTVVPMLSTAHNYNSKDALPIYNFLGSIGLYGKRGALIFSWRGLYDIYNYFPRVQYKNVILSLAEWRINVNEMLSYIQKGTELYTRFNEWIDMNKIPQYVELCEGDNHLLLDLHSELSIGIFLSEVKKRDVVVLRESLRFQKQSIVIQDNEVYSNQFIFGFYRGNY